MTTIRKTSTNRGNKQDKQLWPLTSGESTHTLKEDALEAMSRDVWLGYSTRNETLEGLRNSTLIPHLCFMTRWGRQSNTGSCIKCFSSHTLHVFASLAASFIFLDDVSVPYNSWPSLSWIDSCHLFILLHQNWISPFVYIEVCSLSYMFCHVRNSRPLSWQLTLRSIVDPREAGLRWDNPFDFWMFSSQQK